MFAEFSRQYWMKKGPFLRFVSEAATMASDDDFTFCQVANSNDIEGIEAQKVAQNISVININEGSSSSSSGGNSNGMLWKDNAAVSEKQGKVGSLSFNVIDTSKKAEDVPTQKAPAKKLAPRAKVPFEKGYSQMDWLKLTRTHPDLAGIKGQSNKRLISINEVRQHQNEGSMWTVLKGRVYNIAPYMKFHPGGVDMLMKAVGKDCTSLFNKYHAWVNAEFLLEKCLVGILDESQ